jgi:hypothetical protein
MNPQGATATHHRWWFLFLPTGRSRSRRWWCSCGHLIPTSLRYASQRYWVPLARDLHDRRVPAALAPGRPRGEWTRLPITRLRCTRPQDLAALLARSVVTCASPSDELGPSPGMGGLLREIDRDPITIFGG